MNACGATGGLNGLNGPKAGLDSVDSALSLRLKKFGQRIELLLY